MTMAALLLSRPPGSADRSGSDLSGAAPCGSDLSGATPRPVPCPPVDTLAVWGDPTTLRRAPAYRIEPAADAATLAAYARLRREVFVCEQGLFAGGTGRRGDADDADDDPRTVVLVARSATGAVVGGVRLSPVWPTDVGHWQGSRLVVAAAARRELPGLGAALVRAACTRAENDGVLRFDAAVQPGRERFFSRLGWMTVGATTVAGQPHLAMRWPINRIAALTAATKAPLAGLLGGMRPGGPGFVGDDGAPVPGTDLVAACDAVVPSMVGRDPTWAGWCGVLVNVNDLAAMGAAPIGLLDAVAGATGSQVARVLAGLRAAAQAYSVPVLGGHTQLGVPPGLSVTALGRTAAPVPAGGGLPGHALTLTADLDGSWRYGYARRLWDSTTGRRTAELRAMLGMVGRHRPAAAKDVSMAGVVGTAGMLAEASGCGAVIDVASVPRPGGVAAGDWLTCFPGFAMLTADRTDRPVPPAGPAASAQCGSLVFGSGVSLRWPDGITTPALSGHVTGLGTA
jgi:putative N-acetyltransferase (TIGR04045 family)